MSKNIKGFFFIIKVYQKMTKRLRCDDSPIYERNAKCSRLGVEDNCAQYDNNRYYYNIDNLEQLFNECGKIIDLIPYNDQYALAYENCINLFKELKHLANMYKIHSKTLQESQFVSTYNLLKSYHKMFFINFDIIFQYLRDHKIIVPGIDFDKMYSDFNLTNYLIITIIDEYYHQFDYSKYCSPLVK